MKRIIFSILTLVLLGGCAKVTQDAAPCLGTRPTGAYVSNVIIPSGGSAYIPGLTLYGYNATIHWAGPNGYLAATSNGDNLFLDFSGRDNYGLYTATVFYNGCSSIPDTFYVTATATGAPPCTIASSQYNMLIASYGNSFNTTGGTMTSTYVCSSTGYDINSGTTSGYTFDMYTYGVPTAGGYFDLVSSCYSLSSTSAYVTLSGAGQTYYQSVSGRVYCNVIGGVKYVTFCSATFQRLSDGLNFTMNGNVSYQ